MVVAGRACDTGEVRSSFAPTGGTGAHRRRRHAAGRRYPLFAFGGNALIATSFYVVQRTCRARLAFPTLARFVFWGYQLFIVLAATGYLLGITEAREYAEPEWYVDLWLTIVWVAYLFVFLGTIWKRKEPHIYVANWFYLAFIVTIAMLHVVNNLAIPVSPLGSKSYSAFSGVQDALIQWWYGVSLWSFVLTTTMRLDSGSAATRAAKWPSNRIRKKHDHESQSRLGSDKLGTVICARSVRSQARSTTRMR